MIKVVAALIKRDNKYLLARRSSGDPNVFGKWEFPGGKVNIGEQPEIALQRELKEELKRLKQVRKYKESMDKAKKEKDKNYYLEGMKMLLKDNETPENFESAYEEYQKAYETRKAIIENLYHEIKIIKKLRV